MSHQSFNGPLPSGKSGSRAVRAAVLVCAALALAVPSVKAQTAAQITSCQTAIENYLSAHSEGTIVTSSSTNLATAVAQVIKSNTNTALTPAFFAESALLPYPYGTNGSTGAVRTDVSPTFNRDAAAVLVTGSAIGQVIATGTNATVTPAVFAANVAAITDKVVDVSGTNTAKNLTIDGQTSVVKTALATITNAYAPANTTFKTTLLNTDTALGTALLVDTNLESLPANGLMTILKGAMPGISGTNPAPAPFVAKSFVTGLLTTGSNTVSIPDNAQGETAPKFAVDILTNVVTNTIVDEWVANEVGIKVYNNNIVHQSNLVNIGLALFVAYPNVTGAVFKFAQGLTDAVTQGVNQENQRIAFVAALTTANYQRAVPILKGAVFADPYYAGSSVVGGTGGFTYAVFNSIYAKSPSALLSTATSAAVGVGNMLGQDGNALTQVADTYSTFLAAKKLAVASTGTYASDLIYGAATGAFASYAVDAWGNGGGGKLNLGSSSTSSNIPTASVLDLASIADLFADGVIKYYGSTLNANAATAASQIGGWRRLWPDLLPTRLSPIHRTRICRVRWACLSPPHWMITWSAWASTAPRKPISSTPLRRTLTRWSPMPPISRRSPPNRRPPKTKHRSTSPSPARLPSRKPRSPTCNPPTFPSGKKPERAGRESGPFCVFCGSANAKRGASKIARIFPRVAAFVQVDEVEEGLDVRAMLAMRFP